MPRLPAERFYIEDDGPPAQGDILLGAVSRVIAHDVPPSAWDVLDEFHAELAPPQGPLPSLEVAGGRGLVMVTTHDCGHDKEFNAVVRRTLADREVDESDEDAVAVVVAEIENDTSLDRAIQVSPLIDPASVTIAGAVVDQDLLLGGRVIGYLPVPPLVVAGVEFIPTAVVDLHYRSTLDRLAYAQRLSAVSEEARQQLRYALARLDVLRSPTLETELAAAVGQEIISAKVDKRNPLKVELALADGTTLELLQQPGSPAAGPVSRSSRSVSTVTSEAGHNPL